MAADDLRYPDVTDAGPQPFSGHAAPNNAAAPTPAAPDADAGADDAEEVTLDNMSDEDLRLLFDAEGAEDDLTLEPPDTATTPPRTRDTDAVPPESGFTQEQWDALTPQQRGGWMRRADYDRKLADRTRLEGELQELKGQLQERLAQAQAIIDRANTQTPQPGQPTPDVTMPDANDYVDDLGNFDQARFARDVNEAMKQVADQVVRDQIKPIAERLQQEDESRRLTAEQEQFAQWNQQAARIIQAFPFMADETNPQAINYERFADLIEFAKANLAPNALNLERAMQLRYPREFARALAKYEQQQQAQRQQQAAPGAAAVPPPRTPAGQQRRDTSEIPDREQDPEGFAQALADEVARVVKP